MLAAERGAAANTLAAYRRDLEGAQQLIGDLATADREALGSLGQGWAGLAPSTVARKASALRQFYGFLLDEKLRDDDPSPALPRPAPRRPLPKILSHGEVEALFARAELEAEADRPEALRLLALLELLYGSGLRATELVALPLAAVPRDAPDFGDVVDVLDADVDATSAASSTASSSLLAASSTADFAASAALEMFCFAERAARLTSAFVAPEVLVVLPMNDFTPSSTVSPRSPTRAAAKSLTVPTPCCTAGWFHTFSAAARICS